MRTIQSIRINNLPTWGDKQTEAKSECIISKTEHSSVKGLYQVEYQNPKLDNASDMLGYKGGMYKTVYDPKVIPDSDMIHLGQIAANIKFKEAINSGNRIYNAWAVESISECTLWMDVFPTYTPICRNYIWVIDT